MSTTHPVRNDVETDHEATTVFNGITYGKGASWLKQVYKIMGHEAVSKALKKYFRKYAGGNTEANEFFNVLAEEYNKSNKTVDMGEDFNFLNWADTWLKTSGINVVEPIVHFSGDEDFGYVERLMFK